MLLLTMSLTLTDNGSITQLLTLASFPRPVLSETEIRALPLLLDPALPAGRTVLRPRGRTQSRM